MKKLLVTILALTTVASVIRANKKINIFSKEVSIAVNEARVANTNAKYALEIIKH